MVKYCPHEHQTPQGTVYQKMVDISNDMKWPARFVYVPYTVYTLLLSHTCQSYQLRILFYPWS